MLATQTLIDELAARIERAFRLRRPEWCGVGASAGVWAVAARTLLSSRVDTPDLPLDPELYVASQRGDLRFPNPWHELTRPEAIERYRTQVAAIVRRLRVELSGEVRRAEARLAAGCALSVVLNARNRGISPLGCFIVACRAGSVELAQRFISDAVAQHQACPLYRQASSSLLAARAYPVPSAIERSTPTTSFRMAYAAQLN